MVHHANLRVGIQFQSRPHRVAATLHRGRATANIRAAQAGRESAEIGITSAQAQAQLDVTQAYYDALLADRLLTISDSTLVQAERTLRQVQLTRSVGSTSEFELIRARVTRDNQRPGWLQARTARDLAYDATAPTTQPRRRTGGRAHRQHR
ncbi:MAG: TolC family protein [Gemmatimonadaceae bacterium]|nr:TolC family protein [Gemmatimonadaceae bacterium]